MAQNLREKLKSHIEFQKGTRYNAIIQIHPPPTSSEPIGTFDQISPKILSRHINNQVSPGYQEPPDCPENSDTAFCQITNCLLHKYFQLPFTTCPLPVTIGNI